MFRRHVPMYFALSLVIGLTACASEAGAPDATDAGTAGTGTATTGESAAPPEGATEPLDFGQLTAGTRYALEGPPDLSFVATDGLTAFPSPGGVILTIGESSIRLATGIDDVYVEEGSREPIGADLESVMAAFERNNRISVIDSGTTDLGGVEAAYADMTVEFFENEEGGADIFSIDAAPLFLTDRTINRVIMVGEGDAMSVVIVSGPVADGLDSAMAAVAEILASVQVGG